MPDPGQNPYQQYLSHSGLVSDPAREANTLALLRKNAGKDFVSRILYSKQYPIMKNADGSYSTHRMAWGTVGGEGGEPVRHVAFPTLHYDPMTHSLYEPKNAFHESMKSGNFIEFKDPKEAGDFAEGAYKVGIDRGMEDAPKAAPLNYLGQ